MKNAVRLCSGFVLAVGADLCVRPVGSVRWQCVTNAIANLAHLWETLDSNCPGIQVVTMPRRGGSMCPPVSIKLPASRQLILLQ